MTFTKLFALPTVTSFGSTEVFYAITRDSVANTGFKNENIQGSTFIGTGQAGSGRGAVRKPYSSSYSGGVPGSSQTWFADPPYNGVQYESRIDDFSVSGKISNQTGLVTTPSTSLQFYPNMLISYKDLPDNTTYNSYNPGYGHWDVRLTDHVTGSISNQILSGQYSTGSRANSYAKLNRRGSGSNPNDLNLFFRLASVDSYTVSYDPTIDTSLTIWTPFVNQVMSEVVQAASDNPSLVTPYTIYMGFYLVTLNNTVDSSTFKRLVHFATVHPDTIGSTVKRLSFHIKSKINRTYLFNEGFN